MSMSDSQRRGQPIADLLMLYSVSKSIGTSLDLFQNCKAFLKTLSARLRLDYAAVWLNHSLLTGSGDATGARMVCSIPKVRDVTERLNADDPLIQRLRRTDVFTLMADDPAFRSTPIGAAVKTGALTIFALGNLGALELYVADGDKTPSGEQLELLSELVKRFTTSLGNSLAYNRIRVSEHKYRTLFEESQDAVFISTLSGRILDINPAGAEMLGYTADEVRAMSMSDMFVDEQAWKRYSAALAAHREIKDYEHVLKRKDGKHVYVVETSSPARDDTGQINAYRGIRRDVSEHRELQQQLTHAQKMESLGLMAGGVAHDFNNLLTSILGFGSLLEERVADDPQASSYLATVEQTVREARQMMSQLLGFARKSEYDPQTLDFNALVESTAHLLEPILGRAIVLKLDLARVLPPVDADRAQLQQVIMNLCINARDAMPTGGHLSISTRIVDTAPIALSEESTQQPGPFVMLLVADTGTGMDTETMQRVFDPFFTTKLRGEGTGLGLALVYGVVTKHGGFVTVDSKPGRGSTFKVYLKA